VSLIIKHQDYLLRALVDTGASSSSNSSSSILEAYISDPSIETDDNDTTTTIWITIGDKFTTNKNGICL
jgi:hypothetical protein